ncbi:MAG: cytidylate kinase-like family protein [Candidatus Metalachnospira sp.]|nr:cytidylate kinase-like family protein [Candidatus Metalachnospira sp.]
MGKDRVIITIGRQYGSGGLEIGRRLAKAFNIDIYDKELLTLAAKQSGFNEDVLKENDEKHNGSFLYSLVMGTYTGGDNLPLNHKLFLAQFDTIKKLAEEKSCVIIGRCADYALEYNPNCLKVFIHADIDTRIRRAIDEYGVNPDKVEEIIKKIDKQRENYYNFYTGKKWGSMGNYDITLNSTYAGIDGSVKVIENLIREKMSI